MITTTKSHSPEPSSSISASLSVSPERPSNDRNALCFVACDEPTTLLSCAAPELRLIRKHVNTIQEEPNKHLHCSVIPFFPNICDNLPTIIHPLLKIPSEDAHLALYGRLTEHAQLRCPR